MPNNPFRLPNIGRVIEDTAINQLLPQDVRRLEALIGRAGVHALYPNEVEYYACALELVNSKNQIVDMLVFPVMPQSIIGARPTIDKVQKTASGVVNFVNPTFVPFDITITGNFGRKLRFLLKNFNNDILTSGFSFSRLFKNKQEFSATVKTGYGTTKLLERIYDNCKYLDETNQPYKLFFYNLSFNQAYLVQIMNFSHNMTVAQNMIWHYNLQLKALAPAAEIRDTILDRRKVLSIDVINKSVNTLANVGFLALQRVEAKLIPIAKNKVSQATNFVSQHISFRSR